jgi:cbb3-type cytochrome oxidase cytochrome c subunit
MKGLAPLFLGIFGTFAFSWIGLTVIPTWQIGHLNPEADEEGTDIYPRPQSGMFARGEHVYAANGCVYCHSQQVRADYIADDIERKWGNRRSAPRDYIFDRPIFLGKMRMGQDLANIGARAPAPEESPAPAGAPQGAAVSSSPAEASAKAGPPSQAASPSPASSPPTAAATSPGTSPATAPAASPGTSPASATSPNASPPPAKQGAAVSSPSAEAPAKAGPPPSTANSLGTTVPAAAASPSPAAPGVTGSSPAAPSAQTPSAPWPIQTAGLPPMYSAAWHHVHLYAPRSINPDSNMPAYRFLYEKRRIAGERSAEALQLSGSDAPPAGWEVVPTYDAKCVVAYLMGLNQSHPLKEVRSVGGAPATGAAPSPAAPGASPAPPAGGSPAAPKK